MHTFEVVDLEDGRARFCGGTLKFGSMDLNETPSVEITPEEVGDS